MEKFKNYFINGLILGLDSWDVIKVSGNDATRFLSRQTTNNVNTLQKEADVVNEVPEGEECGLRIDHKELVFEIGDKIQLFVEKK